MIKSFFENIKIEGVAASVPTSQVSNTDFYYKFGEDTVYKVISYTGIQKRYVSTKNQTASDLAYIAADHLLTKKNFDRESIGVLVFAVSFPDYFVPASSMVLQKRLGLSTDCIVYDINLGCSGSIYGLHTAASLLSNSSADKALVLIGDTSSKSISPLDTSSLLFGDAGAAFLISKQEESDEICFGLKSDGSRFKSIIVPAGGFRNPDVPKEAVEWSDGNVRSDYNLYMNGTDVFSFTMTDVPKLFKEFSDTYNKIPSEMDSLILHQSNLFIIKHLAKRLKTSMDNVPISLDRFGNTGGVSVPLTLCDSFGESEEKTIEVMMSGFGVGLSWGIVTLSIHTSDIFPILKSDDYYDDGMVEH